MKHLLYSILQKLNFFFPPSKNQIRVLAYHTVPDERKFEIQLDYLKLNFNIIDLAQLQGFLFHGGKLPKNPLLITFDDGDVSVLENGFPLLKKFKLPSVLFVITGLINSSNTFWCRWVEKAFEQEGKTYMEARAKVNLLKKMPNIERETYLCTLKQIDTLQLSSNQLHYLKNGGMHIANHTHTHPMVDKCISHEIRNELELAHSKFKEWNLKGYHVFAYPNGNWDEQTEKILKENGIEMAFLFDHEINKKQVNPMRISRIMVDTDTEINEFKVKVSGMHTSLMNLKRRCLLKG